MSILYTRSGNFRSLRDQYFGKPLFRKSVRDEREIAIATILQKHPHPNIVTFYTVSPEKKCIDMELLNSELTLPDELFAETAKKAKNHLQSLGIMYIDWKPDQMGVSADGEVKLFDFDCSGLIDLTTKRWVLEPPRFWTYNKALEKGLSDPYEIDDYALSLELGSS